MGSSYEQQISLSWREPLQTYGVIRRYEVSKNQVTMTGRLAACTQS